MTVMHQFHIASIISGVILMLLLILYLIKRKSGVCNVKTIRQNWKGILIAVIIMIVSWIIINYFIVSAVASIVYGNLEIKQKPMGNMKEMAESHNMPTMKNIEIVPEMQGKKILQLKIEGVFCGSCGPSIEYDIKSILGVIKTVSYGGSIFVTYDSDVTNKDVILAVIHEPYSVKIISEEKI
jgi:copper chaperone CopZ